MPRPVAAPLPLVRLLMGALLLVGVSLSVAAMLCVVCMDVAVWPFALPRLRLRYRLSVGFWVLLRLLCAASSALRNLVLCRSRLLLGSVRCPSWLPRCLRLCCLLGSADAYA